MDVHPLLRVAIALALVPPVVSPSVVHSFVPSTVVVPQLAPLPRGVTMPALERPSIVDPPSAAGTDVVRTIARAIRVRAHLEGRPPGAVGVVNLRPLR